MIDFSNISLQFTGEYLFQNVNLKIHSGDKICLVGSNGTGKSSLLKMLTGELEPESGSINKQKNITIGYLPQDQVVHKGKTLIDEVFTALSDIKYLHQKEEEIIGQLESSSLNDEEKDDLVNQLGEVHQRLEELESYSAEYKIEKILTGLGFAEKDFRRLTDEFSGGWQMRIAMAKLLIAQNDLLLFDEPTNHLDLDSLQWLIGYIQGFKGSMIIVSHDKNFVNLTTNRTWEIFLRKINPYNGKLNGYLKYKEERDQLLINQRENQQKKIKDTQRFIERFRYKSTKARQVQSRIKQLEKVELIEIPDDEGHVNIRFPKPPPSGVFNIELNAIHKSFGEMKLFDGIDFRVNRGDKIAFVGPNGAGKTTLAKIIAGKIDINKGERVSGHNSIISYYSQDVADSLNPESDLIETLDAVGTDKSIGQLRSLLGAFLFTGDDVFKKVGVLSGGEKSRLALAKILLSPSNFIILDEPTNHLDYSSKKVLQQALVNFSGSLILVSHDVEFLKPIANRVVDIRAGKVKIYDGDIEYYFYKRNAEIEQLSPSRKISGNIEQQSETTSRKEQKRIEAEKRQQRYKATKELKERRAKLEKEIHKFEQELEKINSVLIDPDSYNNQTQIRELNEKHIELKSSLDKKVKEWEEVSLNLEEIEREFE
ncbi:MAG TPA: ABC-F family ATP-binding cassette domain-containing protein [Ignavibacteriaceae bacterium]|nr:ABC-F family ATP-binding cassette domain-containing protein [Ignavibacteriaceae bacterium]